jgi:hypothetical protein
MKVNRSQIDGCDPLCCRLSGVSKNIRDVVVVRQSLFDQAVPDLRHSFRAVYSGVIRRSRTRPAFRSLISIVSQSSELTVERVCDGSDCEALAAQTYLLLICPYSDSSCAP